MFQHAGELSFLSYNTFYNKWNFGLHIKMLKSFKHVIWFLILFEMWILRVSCPKVLLKSRTYGSAVRESLNKSYIVREKNSNFIELVA